MNRWHRLLIVILASILLVLFTACNPSSSTSTSTITVETIAPTVSPTPEPSQTPIPPTPTPIPLAASVNGEDISLEEFQIGLTQLQASLTITGTILASDTQTTVLNDLIDQTLLAQAATEKGFTVDDAMLQQKIDTLEAQLGGAQALEDWITTHGYSDEVFQSALRRATEAAWMRDQIIAEVPETADQVHIMQILLPIAEEADQVYASLQSGKDFVNLAFKYDPVAGGDLGWFPQSYLNDPAIEQAAFALQPEQYSSVVKTEIGYHILYLVERDPNHKLQPDARKVLQIKALQTWITDRRNQSEIQILLPQP